MKFYLASRFEDRAELFPLRDALVALGHEVTSRWLHEPEESVRRLDLWPGIAQMDLDDIDACDVFIVVVNKDRPSLRGGLHFETGYALGKGKRVWLLGDQTNIFHYLPYPQINRGFRTMGDVMRILRACMPMAGPC